MRKGKVRALSPGLLMFMLAPWMHTALEGLQQRGNFAGHCGKDMSGKNLPLYRELFTWKGRQKVSEKYLVSVAVTKVRFFFLNLTLNISFPLLHPSASVLPALWNYSCAQIESTTAAVGEDSGNVFIFM